MVPDRRAGGKRAGGLPARAAGYGNVMTWRRGMLGHGAVGVLAAAALLAGCVATPGQAPGPVASKAPRKPAVPGEPAAPRDDAALDDAPLVPNGGGNVTGTGLPGALVSDRGAGVISDGGAALQPAGAPPAGVAPAGVAPAGGIAPVAQPAAPLAALAGVVRLPAGIVANNGGAAISNNGGNLITDNGGGVIANNGSSIISNGGASYALASAFGLLQDAPTITVRLVDAAGALLPGTSWTPTKPDGSYAFEQVPTPEGFFVQARVTRGADTWTLGAVGKLAGATGTTLDVSPATTLVAEKARVVLAEQDQRVTDLAIDALAPLVAALATAAADATLDFRQPGAAIAAKLDARLQADAGLVAKARAVDRNVGTPIVRTKTAFADGVFSPEHLAFDRAGNLFVAGLNDHRVYKVPAGTDDIEVFYEGGDLRYPHGIACDAAGNVYVGRRIDVNHAEAGTPNGTDTPGKQVFKITPDGATATALAYTFNEPWGLAFAADGKTLLVCEQKAGDVIAYDTAADTARVYAKDIPYPNGIAVDSRGVAYVTHQRYVDGQADQAENGWRGALAAIAPDGVVSAFYAGVKGQTGADAFEGIAIDAADNLYVTNNWGDTIFKFTPKQKKIETFLKFNQPTGAAFDPRGDLIVADYELGTLARVTP